MSGSGRTRQVSSTYLNVSPSYSKVSEKLRRVSSGSLQCSIFCGGRGCKYETAERWDDKDKILQGVYSHWITEDILAMARPSTMILRKYKLIEQFKSVAIGTVVNLQQPGEHANCGPGLKSSGFTYEPEDFMKRDIYFYNYGWMDYGVPRVDSLLDVIKVVDFATSEGKVAIHCHAGLGRTGVLIACYLVFSKRIGWEEAIAAVRFARPGSLQTRMQIKIVQQFESFMLPLRPIYPLHFSSSCFSFEELLHNQKYLLHGLEQRNLEHVPKVVHSVCSRLLVVCEEHTKSSNFQPVSLLHYTEENDVLCGCGGKGINADLQMWSCEEVHDRVSSIQTEMNAGMTWRLLEQEQDLIILLEVLFQFFQGLKEPLLTSAEVSLMKSTTDSIAEEKCSTLQLVLSTLKVVSLHSQFPERLAKILAYSLIQHPATTRPIYIGIDQKTQQLPCEKQHCTLTIAFDCQQGAKSSPMSSGQSTLNGCKKTLGCKENTNACAQQQSIANTCDRGMGNICSEGDESILVGGANCMQVSECGEQDDCAKVITEFILQNWREKHNISIRRQ